MASRTRSSRSRQCLLSQGGLREAESLLKRALAIFEVEKSSERGCLPEFLGVVYGRKGDDVTASGFNGR